MVDSLWFVLALVLLAVVSVALVLVLVLRRGRRTADARHAPSIYSPTMGRPAGSASRPPSNEIIMPYRYWLIEGAGLGDRLRHCAGPPHEPAHGQDRADALPRRLFLTLAFEDVQQYDIDGVTVTRARTPGASPVSRGRGRGTSTCCTLCSPR